MTGDLRELIATPTRARRLYKRGGCEGLEPNVLQVLIAIELSGQPTVNELVKELALGQSTVSTAIATLAERGLVATAPDSDDRRNQRQRITAAGRALVRRFADAAWQRAEAF